MWQENVHGRTQNKSLYVWSRERQSRGTGYRVQAGVTGTQATPVGIKGRGRKQVKGNSALHSAIQLHSHVLFTALQQPTSHQKQLNWISRMGTPAQQPEDQRLAIFNNPLWPTTNCVSALTVCTRYTGQPATCKGSSQHSAERAGSSYCEKWYRD